jgi:hypothetical protein
MTFGLFYKKNMPDLARKVSVFFAKEQKKIPE